MMGIFSRKQKIDADGPKAVNFYFYFPKEDKSYAEEAEKELARKGFKTYLQWLDYNEGQWSLTLIKQVGDLSEVVKLEGSLISEIAIKYNAEYDGHAIEV